MRIELSRVYKVRCGTWKQENAIKSTEVARVKPASEEQRLIIGAIRHDRVSGEVHGGDGPDREILDEVLANPASSGQAPPSTTCTRIN
jgi:hypothetical protein